MACSFSLLGLHGGALDSSRLNPEIVTPVSAATIAVDPTSRDMGAFEPLIVFRCLAVATKHSLQCGDGIIVVSSARMMFVEHAMFESLFQIGTSIAIHSVTGLDSTCRCGCLGMVVDVIGNGCWCKGYCSSCDSKNNREEDRENGSMGE